MTLLQFMAEQKLSDEQMADLVGVSASAVRKWKYGQRVPRRGAMARLIQATDGAVNPIDFLDTTKGNTQQEAA